MIKKLCKFLPLYISFLAVIAVSLTGCQPQTAATDEPEGEHEADHEHESDHEEESDHEHGARVPNDGAIIHIISPADGASFQEGDEIVVEIEVENFEISADGSHWHLYVDGNVWSQVVGGGTREVIRGLEAGEHEIEVYLGLPTHEELEDGDSIMITVTE